MTTSRTSLDACFVQDLQHGCLADAALFGDVASAATREVEIDNSLPERICYTLPRGSNWRASGRGWLLDKGVVLNRGQDNETKARNRKVPGLRCCAGPCIQCPQSHVDHVSGEAVEGVLHRLAERGVGVHVSGELIGGQFPSLRERQLR